MWRSYDAFAKPVHGVRQQSVIGGLITIIAATSAILLFLSHLFFYIRSETRQSLHMSESMATPLLPHSSVSVHSHSFPIRIRMTFPHIKCDDLDFSHDGARGEDIIHSSRSSLSKKNPTHEEMSVFDKNYIANGINLKKGCTIYGKMMVPRVGGNIGIGLSLNAWKKFTMSEYFLMQQNKVIRGPQDLEEEENALQSEYNVSHYIHQFEFGVPFTYAPNRIQHQSYVFKDIGLSNIVVKIINTKYKRSLIPTMDMHQISAVQHIVKSETFFMTQGGMVLLPGLAIGYDFTPLMVRHVVSRENIFIFLSSLVSIVGGVFVTVSLVSSLLINSAAAVAKKID